MTDFDLPFGALPYELIALLLFALGVAWLVCTRLSRRRRRPAIVVDGSNVMHWGGGDPSAEKVSRVLEALVEAGFDPEVWFDANVGYKLVGRYAGPRQLARFLPVPASSIRVVDKGVPADPELIAAAFRLGVRIVSNDRFRDWQEDFPGLAMPDRVISGRLRDGIPEFDLG